MAKEFWRSHRIPSERAELEHARRLETWNGTVHLEGNGYREKLVAVSVDNQHPGIDRGQINTIILAWITSWQWMHLISW